MNGIEVKLGIQNTIRHLSEAGSGALRSDPRLDKLPTVVGLTIALGVSIAMWVGLIILGRELFSLF